MRRFGSVLLKAADGLWPVHTIYITHTYIYIICIISHIYEVTMFDLWDVESLGSNGPSRAGVNAVRYLSLLQNLSRFWLRSWFTCFEPHQWPRELHCSQCRRTTADQQEEPAAQQTAEPRGSSENHQRETVALQAKLFPGFGWIWAESILLIGVIRQFASILCGWFLRLGFLRYLLAFILVEIFRPTLVSLGWTKAPLKAFAGEGANHENKQWKYTGGKRTGSD